MKQAYLHGVSTLQLSVERCTGCGRCREVCPHGVFIIDKQRAAIAFSDNCMECGACAQNCSFEAITVKNGVGCAIAMINGLITKGDPDKGTCDCGNSGDCC